MNNDTDDLELDTRLHALLCGEADDRERADLLGRLAREERLRERLREMVRLQQLARAAVGLDTADEAVRAVRPRFIASLSAHDARPAAASTGIARRLTGARWLWRVAAVAVIAASVYVAFAAERSHRLAEARLAAIGRAAAMPQVTDAEVVAYRQLWRQIAGSAGTARPWILMGHDSGEFGYLPGTGRQPRGGQLLVRYCITEPDGRPIKTVSLILPGRRAIEMALPDVWRVAGRPVHCDVAAHGEMAVVGVAVDGGPAVAPGVRGRVRIGGAPVELGRFRIDERVLRVEVQVTPIQCEVS